MLKKIGIITLVLATLIAIPGCGTNSNTATDQQSAQSSQTQQNQVTNSDGKMPEKMEQADLRGEVTSISSNQVTVKVIKMSEPGAKGPDRNGGTASKNTEGDNGKDGNMAPPSDDKQPSSDSKSGNESQRRGGAVQYTGETKTITIPTDMEITTFARGDDKNQSVKLADLKQGDILEVWYSDKNNETIEKISVRSANQKNDSTAEASTTK